MSKLSIILFNPPYKKTIIRDNYCCFTSKSGYLWPPADLLYLSGILNNKKIKLSVIDSVADKLSETQILQKINKIQPNILISLTGTVSYKTDLKLLEKIFKQTQVQIYLLGNTPAYNPKYFLSKYKFIQGIIHNYFDNNLCNYFLDSKQVPKSLSYKQNNQIFLGTINCFQKNSLITHIKPPQYQLFPIKKYKTPLMKDKPMVTSLTTFGCPYKCKFCINSTMDYISRDISDLQNEFDAIKKANIKEIFFEDGTFNAKPDQLENICNLLIKNRYQFSWSANIHSLNVTEKTLILMKQAGCHTVNIGVESGNQKTLDTYAPSKNINQIKKAFKTCKKIKLRTLGYFIIGFPNENSALSQKTIALAKELNPNFASFSTLTPDYGTPMHKELLQNHMIKKGIFCFDSSDQSVIKNHQFTQSEQDKLIKNAYMQFYIRPIKILLYLIDFKNYPSYFYNGINLIKNKILNDSF